MKRAIMLLAAVWLCAVPLYSAPLTVTVKARRLVSSKGVNTTWKTDYGSYNKDFARSIAIETEVRNTSTTQGVFRIQVYFTAKPLAGGDRFFFDGQQDIVTLKSGETKQCKWMSGTLKSSDNRYALAGERYQEGSVPEGYIVRVIADDVLLNSFGSTYQLESIAKNEKVFDGILQKSISDNVMDATLKDK